MSEEAKLREALEAANALINRLQERVGETLARKGEIDEARSFYDIVEMLETAREIDQVRMALGDDPMRFGEPTPLAAGDNTG